MKQNNPGCNCCEGGNCEGNCWYACANGTKPCPHPCGIRIEMPTPDDVSEANGPTCVASECTITAKCNACLDIFDNVFVINRNTAEDYDIEITGDCNDRTIKFFPRFYGVAFGIPIECWTYANYDCPYETPFSVFPCGAEYTIAEYQVIWNVKRVDGCAETTITIKYDVVEQCDSVAIPPNPPLLPTTTYEHIFKRTHCDCDDVYGAVPFDSTVATNNARGITVPDVCNADSATIEITGECGICRCFDCGTGDIVITLESGTCVTGTVALSFDSRSELNRDCRYSTSVPCPNADPYYIELFIECLPCEKYTLTLVISNVVLGYGSQAVFKLENISCGEGGTFSYIASYPIEDFLSDAVVSLSSL